MSSALIARSVARWSAVGLALGALIGLLLKELDLPSLVSYAGAREPLVLLAAAAGGLLWRTRLRPLIWATATALCALWCGVAFTPLSAWLAEGLVRRELVEPADAVFVSFAALHPDQGQEAEARSRVLTAADLLWRGKAPYLVAAENPRMDTRALVNEMMTRFSLDERKALFSGTADNTREEAVALGELSSDRGWDLVIVVTSPIHSFRATAAMAAVGVNVTSSPASETRFALDDLTRASDRIRAFGGVMHERVGIGYYVLRGWLPRTAVD